MKNKLLSIGDVSRISGVHIKSLRYYGEIGVLKPAYVNPETGYRYYTQQQLGVLDAIRTCIDLDIPLNEFAGYIEDEGRIVHYARLLEHGKKLANQKISTIREGIRNIELMQREIERSLELQKREGPVVIDVPMRRCYVMPFDEIPEEDTYLNPYENILLGAAREGYKVGYEVGRMYLYNQDRVRRYYFVEVISSTKRKSKNLIIVSSGQCISKCTANSRIEYAREEFPDQFALDHEKIIVETELFTADYNVAEPQFELSCMLPEM